MTHYLADTVTVEFSNGESLTGTRTHPVFVQEKGWVAMDALNLADIVEVCHNQKKLSCSTGSPSFAIQRAKVFLHGDISIRSKMADVCVALADCIRKFGNSITDLFQKVWKSITREETSLTTVSEISNVLRRKSIGNIIECARQQSERIVPSNVQKKRHGVDRESQLIASAKFAESNIKVSHCKDTIDFAVINVPRNGITTTRHFGRNRIVSGARRNSLSLPAVLPCAAPVRVLRKTDGLNAVPVFNLTVAGTHEYYANGILVHNCDSMNLAVYNIDYRAPEVIQVDDTPRLRDRVEEVTHSEHRSGWMGRRSSRRGLFRD